MTTRTVQALVFDWDGTIIDSTRLIVDSMRSACSDLELTMPSRTQAASMIGLPLAEAAKRLVPGAGVERIEAFVERYRFYFFQKDASLQPFIGMSELLDELRRYSVWLSIATGKSRVGLMRALAELHWDDRRFVSLRCGDDHEPKPHPWMLTDLAEELGLEASDLLMIGDTTHDLAMARSAGVEAIAVSYGAQPENALRAFLESASPDDPRVTLVTSVSALREQLLGRIERS
jgi:phosphoglycolate phosphatase